MNIKPLVYTLAICILAILSGCGDGTGKKINQGVITYHLEYPKSENKSALVSMLPETMKMRFKESNTAMEIVGFGGSFGLNFITNLKENKSYSMLRVLFNKYLYESDTTEVSFGYGRMKDIQISETGDTATICGYLCHKAVGSTGKADYELWYTQNINIDNPNANNPFKQINGVLLKFDVHLSGIYMKVEAIDIKESDVADEYFQVPDGYQKVSKEELENVIRQFDKSM